MELILAFLVSLVTSLAAVPAIRWLSFKTGKVAQPRTDRWHSKPTPKLGGIGIYLGFCASVLAFRVLDSETWIIFAGAGMMFTLGIWDDLRELSPPAKLIGQILAASLVIFGGYQIEFFNIELLNILLTFLWLIGITNAINLLDNMDGLAGGISLIVVGFLSFFFFQARGQEGLMYFSLALAGGILGFLVFNFPPAKIFMGDSGSLFIGFLLASLAVARRTSASNVFAVLGIPTLLFLIPIIDTSLVTITRVLRGQSPAQGGRDHTSHRLVAFGLTERQTAIVLYSIAIVSGIFSTAVERLAYDFSLLVVPVLIVAFSLLAAYLGRLKVVPGNQAQTYQRGITRVVLELTYRQRIFEVLLDFFLISIAFYLALWSKFEFSMSADELQILLHSLPVALAATYISFYSFGVYRGMWEYFGLSDIVGYSRAVAGGVLLTAAASFVLFPEDNLNVFSFLLYGTFLLLLVVGSRSSFRVLDQIYASHLQQQRNKILLLGAKSEGELAARYILGAKDTGYLMVGFLDPDEFMWGKSIHGVKVLGGYDALPQIIERNEIGGIILTSRDAVDAATLEKIVEICQAKAVWVKKMRLEFDELV